MHVEYPMERPNFVVVQLPDCALAFSYKTLIGVKSRFNRGERDYEERWHLAKNTWGPTTGKHLNLLDHFNHERVPQAEVERIAYEILTGKAQALLTDLHTAHNAAIEAFK